MGVYVLGTEIFEFNFLNINISVAVWCISLTLVEFVLSKQELA